MIDQAMIVFSPSGKRGSFPIGTSVLQAARELGVDLDSVCGGRGMCGRCQVQCASGEFSKHNIISHVENLGESTSVEARYQRIHGVFADGRRLGCQAIIQGDLAIDIPAESQVHRQLIRKALDHANITINPAVRLYVVDVQEPDMHDPSGDLRRLKQALMIEWGLTGLNASLGILRQLQETLRKGKWQVTVAVHENRSGAGTFDIIGLWPGYKEAIYGVAIDVGSTTIAGHLCNLATGQVLGSSGAMNPQIRFGEDLMSRVSYVMMNPGGDVDMTHAVIEAINDLIRAVSTLSGILPEDILELTFVANPVMHHLLLGINPIELGGAPFALCTDESLQLPAAQMGLKVHPLASVYLLPCVAGHVGADTAGVVLSEQPQGLDELSLLVDVGTNAEIVLGNRERLVACSSPTGPAFEGAQISGGQRAAPGAIERVRIDPQTLEPKYSVIGSDTWSDDPAFAMDAAAVGVTGICGSGIIEVVAEMFLAGIINSDGVLNGELAARNSRIEANERTFSYLLHKGAEDGGVTVRITQNDVRQIQLAKAALYAGIRLLMDRLQVERVDRIRLAGAFGSHIDVKYAMVLGLLPDCDLSQVSSAGNAAGSGALMALLDKEARTEIEQIVRCIEKVETAVEADFQQHFVEAMAFPHKTASFPELGKVVQLPAPSSARPVKRRRVRRN
ncbi:ASKHA domain-containing protein [Granulosicoccus antarcticus]|uniref:Na(+)-translocating NADH-quinone reductase subunit F n=1 Tax=Granulosicoccus antarcticus IMCC3135 TaxID=1192854 RepID=A0A2Z2P2L0_9GAMM|nr:ASKHA domain-containing protein [Granulosicoccus antarcticus]ASJ75590.1 Na(+)-translocating NADH-quinone reductase subunit F [Granulosicoccus antarcticus IMCC3135]